MKTIITTICLAIILQFSAHTSVYADTATICAGEKYRAQHFAEPMSEKCRNYGQSSNLIPYILLGIVVLVIGIPLVAFLFAGFGAISEKATERIARKEARRATKEWEKSKAGQKYKKEAEKEDDRLRIEAKKYTEINEELEIITGKDFKGSKIVVPSSHPIDVSLDSDGNEIGYILYPRLTYPDRSQVLLQKVLTGKEYKLAPTKTKLVSMYFLRRTFKYKKPDLITIADYYKVEYDEKDSIKTIQEKIYDALERELSSGRFKDCLRYVVVWSFCSMQLYYEELNKLPEKERLDKSMRVIKFGTLEIAAFEKAAYQKKQIFPDQCQKFINST